MASQVRQKLDYFLLYALFLLATGNPKYQGIVRRIVYGILADSDPTRSIEPTNAGKSWHNSNILKQTQGKTLW